MSKGATLTTRVIYRIAAVLILLFDVGHTAGYPWSDPSWGVDLSAVQSSHFKVLGFTRTYWNFYVGFGLFVSVFMLLAAIFAWQLSNLPAETLRLVRLSGWALSVCFAAVTVLSWMYFFTIPIAFSGVITVCLIVAAWRSARTA